MMDKTIKLLKQKPITLPRLLLENYKKLKLDNDEFILLIYLLNEETSFYDAKKISVDLDFELMEILSLTESLKSKDIIKVETKRVNNRIEEHISFEEVYKKLALIVAGKEEVKSTNIFDVFESEFGRTLSGMEYEIINAWLTSGGFSEELIISALKEATYNGVSNLRYIDKILYEWKKKGIKNKEDIDTNRKQFIKSKEKTEELYEYDWLNEE